MLVLASLADIRDAFIIIYGTIGIIFFFIASIVTLVVGLTVRNLIRNVNGMLDESVKPTISSIREAADTVRGTTEFVGKTAITPIVRTYGTFAGVKKGLSVVGGLTRKKGS
jgi:hypothetical protein